MQTVFQILPEPEGLMPYALTRPFDCTKERADWANMVFDAAVKQFLRDWIDKNTVAGRSDDFDPDTEAFIETGALRSFFKHHDDALEQLLTHDDIARHLLRPVNEVYFQSDAYEPLLAKFERRIYNLAAHREHREVSFRYSPPSRQGDYGDSVDPADLPADQFREDIGTYFGTRRSDETALSILATDLRREAATPTRLPIGVITDGYMMDSLHTVRALTEQAHDAGDDHLHCFIIQRRHAADDRHLGAALLLMNPQQPDRPQRVIFCDTLNPSGTPPWWQKFKHKLNVVFPQPEGLAPVSDRLEDGGVNLQRLHDGVPVRHQDIDCAFYTASICRALIQLATVTPDLILTGSIGAIVSEMTARMPEYYSAANQPKAPAVVREENVVRRWNTGREALQNLLATKVIELDLTPSVVAVAESA